MTTLDQLNARSQGYLPGLIGIEFLTMEPGRLTSCLALRPTYSPPTEEPVMTVEEETIDYEA
jgi:hypothetical protein